MKSSKYERKWGNGKIIDEVEKGTEDFLWVKDSRGDLKSLGKKEAAKARGYVQL